MLSAKARLWRWVLDEVVHAPVEPILHPSRYRLLWIGAFTFIGHLVIYGIWGHLVPQPYENVWARLVMAFLALIYVLPAFRAIRRPRKVAASSAWPPGSSCPGSSPGCTG